MQSFPWLLVFVKEVDSLSALLNEHLESVVGHQKGKYGSTSLTLKVSSTALEVPDSARHSHTLFYDHYYYLPSL